MNFINFLTKFVCTVHKYFYGDYEIKEVYRFNIGWFNFILYTIQVGDGELIHESLQVFIEFILTVNTILSYTSFPHEL